MKSLQKSALALLLLLTMCLSLGACADKDPGSEVTTPSASTTAVPEDSSGEPEDTSPAFPEADYGGMEFGVYFRSQTAAHYRGLYIIPLENSVDIIDQDAETRNMQLEEKYHIRLVSLETDSPSGTLQKDVSAGELPYHVVLDKRNSLGPVALKGVLADFHDLKVDLTTEWWDANAASQYEVGGRLFLMPNDVSVGNLAGCRFFYFNKAVLEDFRLKSPYEFAAEDDWTVENFFSLVKGVSAPNADGTVGVYGLLNESANVRIHMLTGIGVPSVEKNADGEDVCTIGDNYAERTQDFFDLFRNVANDKSVCISMDDAHSMDSANAGAYSDKYTHGRGLFAQGHFLFTHTDMDSGAREFNETEKGFGVIMNPKLNKDQKEYYHMMDAGAVIWGIPDSASVDLELVGTVMNYWAYLSKNSVMESFYELTLKSKRASDPTAASMLDTVKGSIRYYMTDIYSVDLKTMLNDMYSGSVSNAWKTYKKSLSLSFEKIRKSIAAID